jgi:Cu-processing system ATP-binding protein
MIAFERFSKRFGRHDAVIDLTFRVDAGEAVALLGPNGSGKTTTIKAAAGLIWPTAGTVRLGAPGLSATDADARRIASFLPQRVSFADALTGREVVEFYRQLRGLDAGRSGDVLRFAALNGSSDRAVGTYSGGMVQRLGLAVAMLPNAPILLLDEPTASLDPDGICAFYGLLDQRRQTGATVLFSSHQMGDVERLADRFAVLVAGRLVASFTQPELTLRLADRGVMRVRVEQSVEGLLGKVRALAPRAIFVHDEFIVPGSARSRPDVLDAIRAGGAVITGLAAEEGRLDRFYQELVDGESAPGGKA